MKLHIKTRDRIATVNRRDGRTRSIYNTGTTVKKRWWPRYGCVCPWHASRSAFALASSWVAKLWRVILSREALARHPESRSSGASSWVAKRRKDRCPSKAVDAIVDVARGGTQADW